LSIFSLEIAHKGNQKKHNFPKSTPRIFYIKPFLQENKNLFLSETTFCHSLTKELCTFLEAVQNCASFDTLGGQFGRNLFSTLTRVGGRYFFEDKMSNQVETVQHLKKALLKFQGGTKII
jgi:hypothetical protein